jgi:aconitate hydratase A / 2-methylisocitrate dehydratase
MARRRMHDPFGARALVKQSGASFFAYRLDALEHQGVLPSLDRLPFSLRVLLESVLRNCDGVDIPREVVENLARWQPEVAERHEIPFLPARVLLQDFTGLPCLVDLAAMRTAVQRLGGDPARVNPLIPVDLVIDHSVQVDQFGAPTALARNAEIEFDRNRERYAFLRWGQAAFENLRVVPPATGIVHQVNLEYLAGVVLARTVGKEKHPTAMPDTLVGTDSHTTMVNGLGVLGWGVGGIEAEAVMLGQPLYFLTPQVVGVRLSGELREGVTATDLVLTLTHLLRTKGVVDKFVEFYGPGLAAMSLPDRATIGNMAPEYGATCGFFPVDDETLSYLRRTGRAPEHVARVERYCKEQHLFRSPESPEAEYSDRLELDLGTVEPSLAGPRRPQDRVALGDVKRSFALALREVYGKPEPAPMPPAPVAVEIETAPAAEPAVAVPALPTRDGDVVIAAITSCTNTSNPSVMVAAGLLAKKAVERGLHVPGYVKTSLAPGSKVVSEYLQAAGLQPFLDELGFHVVGYGCTTCIGNSGPLPAAVAKAVQERNLVAAAVLSGNRNFEGRVHPLTRANYLASPPLVVAYALAGTMAIDLANEPLGTDSAGVPVFLRDLWPSRAEIAEVLTLIQPEMFSRTYADVFEGNPTWNAIPVGEGVLYAWERKSTYIQEPPFFEGLNLKPAALRPIQGARVLAIFGDSLTTDHISPAGDIAESSPAGQYLRQHNVSKAHFNSYGARRGNHQVMARGTFANIRIKNALVPGVEGGFTVHLPDADRMSIYDAAMRYQEEGLPLVVIAGKEYGTGSSRDWAAKGPLLLGVRAVIAESFERIHRANLVGMGVLPLQFNEGENAATFELNGSELITIQGLSGEMSPGQEVTVIARRDDGTTTTFTAVARLDTPVDVLYYRNGGILPTVMRQLVKASRPKAAPKAPAAPLVAEEPPADETPPDASPQA